MLKKLLLVSSLGLLSACSSTHEEDASTTNTMETSGSESMSADETKSTDVRIGTGDEITPVNLLEENLSLTESILSVTVGESKSTINFSIEYSIPQTDQKESDSEESLINSYQTVVLNSQLLEHKLQALIKKKEEEKDVEKELVSKKNKKTAKVKKNKKSDESDLAAEEMTEKDKVDVAGIQTLTLENDDSSQNCSDDVCEMQQTMAFDVDTQMLVDAQENGFVFLLKPKEGERNIEIMIPESYLQDLFKK